MIQIVPNAVPYLLASLATLVVGIRSSISYRRLRTPLSRHFAVSGFLASVGLGLYSAPFFITNDGSILKACLIVGRAALDLVAYLQIFLVWYLTYLRRFSLWWLVVPLIFLAVPGYIAQVQHFLSAELTLVDGQAPYTLSNFARNTHAISLLIVFAAGVVQALYVMKQKNARGRIRLFSVALLYMLAAASDMYNIFFLQGLNNSWVVLIGYAIASGVFLITTAFYIRHQK